MSSSFSPPSLRPPHANRYDFRGAVIEAPRDWMEESLLALSAPGPRPQPTITLARVAVDAETTLELYAARRVADLSQLVAGLKVEESREVTFGGQRGIQLRLLWEELPGRVLQRLLFTKHQDAFFVLALNCFEEQALRAQPVFDSVALSFRLPPPPLGASR